MKKWINFWLAVGMTANGICLALTGLILHGAARGGPGRGVEDGAFLLWSRHDWRDLHYRLALLFTLLIIVHLVLHWDWIMGRLRELKKDR